MSILGNKLRLTWWCLPLFYFFALTACATVPQERFYDGFIIVKVKAADKLSSLSARYLNDPAKEWIIADFNGIETLTPGQEVIIPLKPYEWGGIKANGYKTVPILTYYGFSEDKTGELRVLKTAFEEQMRFLKENGYCVITLDKLVDFLNFNDQIPDKSVVITFDDGWRSFYDFAFPVLKDYGFPATLFVYPDFIGNKEALSWGQITELAENGIDIQCKIQTPRHMAKLGKKGSFKAYFEALEREVFQSKGLIEQKLNRECKYVAYPQGATSNLVTAMLKKSGYHAAFTTKQGSNPFFVNDYMINRSVISGEFDIDQFKNNLAVFSDIELK
jgi:peptidoglycan/xylan/chitin deacetylase (PgdA/CDA1 family)